MSQPGQTPRYLGSYRVGFVILAVVALRDLLNFLGTPAQAVFFLLLAAFTLLYSAEPFLSRRFPWHRYLYFPVQIILVVILANLQPFTDITCLLFIPLGVQTQQVFPARSALAWTVGISVLLVATLARGMPDWGWLGSSALFLVVGSFLISYDRMYLQTRLEQAKSQVLLADLQITHRKLERSTAQAAELVAARERNRLARELHDSVSQVIFSINLTAQSARLLLERDPQRVPAQLEQLQEMTAGALVQLRSLIAELRPPAKETADIPANKPG